MTEVQTAIQIRQNYWGLTDYRLTNDEINLYEGDRLLRSICFFDFADFMGWDIMEATDRLTEPDEDFGYYLDRMSDYLSMNTPQNEPETIPQYE